jgi:hypothetical protein
MTANYVRARALSNRESDAYSRLMVTRADILVLGLTAGVIGCLVGGMLFGIGMGLVVQRVHMGWLLILPSAPLAGGIGYLLARKLARKLR